MSLFTKKIIIIKWTTIYGRSHSAAGVTPSGDELAASVAVGEQFGHFPNYQEGGGTGLTGENENAAFFIRHLPEAIPQETLSRLFSHYGATSVRLGSHGRMRNCACGFR